MRLTGTCTHCKKEFQRRKQRSDPMLFCSRECYIEARIRNGGPKHPSWKGGIASRSAAEIAITRTVVRAVARCQRCGAVENLHGHHIQSYADRPDLRLDPSNIMVLCAPCHALEHPEIAGLVTRPQIRTGKSIACVVCGKLRYKQPFELKHAKYCSYECANSGRYRAPSGKHISCVVCGKSRYISPVHFGKVKYCSLKCYYESRKGDHTRGVQRSGREIECIVCGKLRYANKAVADRVKFCSRTCMGIARRQQSV